MAIEIADYLFPSALEITAAAPSKVLVLGACMAEQLVWKLRDQRPNIQFDLTLYNNVAALPELSAEDASAYDLVYASLPLRDVLTDQVVDFVQFARDGEADRITETALVRLEQILSAVLQYNRDHGLLTLVANFLVPQAAVANALLETHGPRDLNTIIRRLNVHLADLIRRETNVYLADIDSIGGSLGKSNFLDYMVQFYAHAGYFSEIFTIYDQLPALNPAGPPIEPLPNLKELYNFQIEQYFRAVWRQVEALYRTINQIDVVKLVVFDLDDTLWRGQIAEHYGDEGNWPTSVGWPLGLWEAIQHLRSRGILVGVCSKNEESIVRERWGRGIPLPWLQLDDFAFKAIGWQPKAEAIASMMKAASLTARSVVFVDDNPIEREAVRSAFPGMRTLGGDPYTIRRVLLWAPETQVPRISRETTNREAMMAKQQLRENDRAVMTRDEFLDSLKCCIELTELRSASDPRFSRALELLNKTNQFNTTGERFTHQDMVSFFEGGGKLYVFEVSDKFTRYGLVGVIRFKDNLFAQFAMSCRVLGLEIEASVVAYIISKESAWHFEARVIETPLNAVSRDVYTRSGFDRGADEIYTLQRSSAGCLASHLTFLPQHDYEAAE